MTSLAQESYTTVHVVRRLAHRKRVNFENTPVQGTVSPSSPIALASTPLIWLSLLQLDQPVNTTALIAVRPKLALISGFWQLVCQLKSILKLSLRVWTESDIGFA